MEKVKQTRLSAETQKQVEKLYGKVYTGLSKITD